MKVSSDRDRGLCLVRSVVSVFERGDRASARWRRGRRGLSPGRSRSSPRNLEGGAGNRPVVGEHPHRRVAQPFRDRDDLRENSSPSDSSTTSGRAASGRPLESLSGTGQWSECDQWCPSLNPSLVLPLPRRAEPFSALASIGRGLVPSIVGGLDLFCDECSVVFHPSNQRGTSGVLPGQAEEVQPWHVGDSTPVNHATIGIENAEIQSRSSPDDSPWPRSARRLQARPHPRSEPHAPRHPPPSASTRPHSAGAAPAGSTR